MIMRCTSTVVIMWQNFSIGVLMCMASGCNFRWVLWFYFYRVLGLGLLRWILRFRFEVVVVELISAVMTMRQNISVWI